MPARLRREGTAEARARVPCRCEDRIQSVNRANARTGKLPIPFTLAGTAKNRKPVSGSAPRWHRCSTIGTPAPRRVRSEEHTSELQSRLHLVCRLLLEK